MAHPEHVNVAFADGHGESCNRDRLKHASNPNGAAWAVPYGKAGITWWWVRAGNCPQYSRRDVLLVSCRVGLEMEADEEKPAPGQQRLRCGGVCR